MGKPKYPAARVEIDLAGPDGNAFAIMGRVSLALESVGADGSEVRAFRRECKAGDYENLLRVCARWVSFSTIKPSARPYDARRDPRRAWHLR